MTGYAATLLQHLHRKSRLLGDLSLGEVKQLNVTRMLRQMPITPSAWGRIMLLGML